MAVDFPQPQIAAMQALATSLLERRKPGTELGRLARDLLLGFHDTCTRAGLDRVLVELEQTLPSTSADDPSSLADHGPTLEALVAQLRMIKLDGGGPRQDKPRQVVDCVVAALALTVVEPPDRRIALGDDVRRAVAAELAGVVDAELSVPKIRHTIIAEARTRCAETFHASFAKVVDELDDRGQQLVRVPKVPIDALHATQRALSEARTVILERVAATAIDRAAAVIARADAAAATRIDQPITLRATPREVAILRASDPRLGGAPAKVVHALLESLTELVSIAWRAPEQRVRPYAASATFAVGDVIDHPKFGRGSVVACNAQRIDVQFADGKHTLVHVPR